MSHLHLNFERRHQHASLYQLVQTTATIALEGWLLFSSGRGAQVQRILGVRTDAHNHYPALTYLLFRTYRILTSWFLLPSFGHLGAALSSTAFFYPLNFISTRALLAQLTTSQSAPLNQSNSLHGTIRALESHELQIGENYSSLVVTLAKVMLRFTLPKLCHRVVYATAEAWGAMDSTRVSPLPNAHTPPSLRESRPVLFYWIKYKSLIRVLLMPLWAHYASPHGVLLMEEFGGDETDLLISTDRDEEMDALATVAARQEQHVRCSRQTLMIADVVSLLVQVGVVSAICYPLSLVEIQLHMHPEKSVWSIIRGLRDTK